jgi:hypothetical protein
LPTPFHSFDRLSDAQARRVSDLGI